MLIYKKNIDISPNPPFEKRGLSRFAPGARIVRVSELRSTANAVKIQTSLPYFFAPFYRQSGVVAVHREKIQVRTALQVLLAPILLSEWGRYNARQKIPTMDSTWAYSHCRDIFVSGSRCPAITTKSRKGIVSTTSPRMTLRQSLDCQPTTLNWTIFAKSLKGILGAGRGEATGRWFEG